MKVVRALTGIFLTLFFLCIGVVCWYIILTPIPDLESFKDIHSADSVKITDREGVLLHTVAEKTKKRSVPIEDIPEQVILATLAIEDHTFYKHRGIRPKSILRAFISNVRNTGVVQGGSTITQQLIKNLLLTRKRDMARKIKEMVLSVKIEMLLSKNEILELYFNTISYGGNTTGIAEAAFLFFNKNIQEVTVAESAYLAALPKSPSFLSPFGKNKDLLEERKNIILKKMLEYGFITTTQYNQAAEEWVVFQKNNNTIKAPHFVFFVIHEIKKTIRNLDGITVKTTLNYALQQEIETIISESNVLDAVGAKNIAVIVLDAERGDILTMVGSHDYFNTAIDGNVNILTSAQQPGSAFKPFTYSAAFEKGFTPETIVFDVPTQFSTYCKPQDLETDVEKRCYAPKNYMDTYTGPVSLRNALAQSINIPTVKTAHLTKIDTLDTILKKTGLGKDVGNIYAHGLPIAIGSAEVTPLHLANAYSIFSNRGLFVPYRFLLSTEKNGTKISEPRAPTVSVISPETADAVNDILVDDRARGGVFGRGYTGHTPLYFPDRSFAVKTGTTNQTRDLWIVGYNTRIVVAIWAGNSDNTPTKKNASGSLLAPILRRIVNTEQLMKYPKQPFQSYQKQLSTKETIINSGILRGMVNNQQHSSLYYIDKEDALLEYWDYGVNRWLKKNDEKKNFAHNVRVLADQLIKNNKGNIVIKGADTFKKGEVISITLESGEAVDRYEIYLDNRIMGVVYRPSFSFPTLESGIKNIFVVGFKKNGESVTGEKTVTVLE